MPAPTLVTPRLVMRAFTPLDAERYHRLLGGESVLRYFPDPTPPSRERSRELLQRVVEHWEREGFGLWALEDRATGEFVGRCGLQRIPDTGEIEADGILDRPHWGLGLALEAATAAMRFGFLERNMASIVGIVHPENGASRRVLEKLGMRLTGAARYFGMECLRYEIARAAFLEARRGRGTLGAIEGVAAGRPAPRETASGCDDGPARTWVGGLSTRRYGSQGPSAIVLHGGPGAAGSAAPIARGLARSFRVLEPWQRPSGGEPLTVARHVADLDTVVRETCAGKRPLLVGESWGAMLALAYAASHPDACGPLVLAGCGTFDPASRERLRETRRRRIGEHLDRHSTLRPPSDADSSEAMLEWHRITDDYELAAAASGADEDPDAPPFDPRAGEETWRDMLRCQAEGLYPRAFAAITAPVLMAHGAFDPHPGSMIRASLEPFIPHLEYHEWERCGHRPWLEKAVGPAFFEHVIAWAMGKLGRGDARRPEALR
jgi:RimJ/RimL family protein N-acetyltransferase/alpha-beta hydrolase superfamily lysophospholipase